MKKLLLLTALILQCATYTYSQSNIFPTPSGNVGIGVSGTPAATLHIGSGTGSLHYGGTNGVLIKFNDGDRATMELHCPDGTNRLVLQSLNYAAYLVSMEQKPLLMQALGGPVSIGLNAIPTASLHVGSGTGNLHAGNNGVLIKFNDGDRALMELHSPDGQNRLSLQSLTNASYLSSLDQKPLVLQDAGGNVGIGTVSPQTKLHLSGTSAAFRIDDTNGDNSSFCGSYYDYAQLSVNRNPSTGTFSNTGKAAAQFAIYGGNADGHFEFYTSNANNTMPTEKMRLTANGYLGIGTNSPAYPLTVNGNAGINGYLNITNGSETGQIRYQSGGIELANTGILRLGNDFHALTDNVYIRSLSGNDYYSIFSSGSGSPRLKVQQINGKTDDLLQLVDASSTKLFTVTNAGNVGIGTAVPQAKLSVNGDIFAKKVKVTPNGWSDYVFNTNYYLRPLQEVEKYIQQHHHLPEVPSAVEVAKDGLDLGNNQATLLKKIEELTLYMIEQNKTLQNQQKLIEQQTSLLKSQQEQLDCLRKQIKK